MQTDTNTILPNANLELLRFQLYHLLQELFQTLHSVNGSGANECIDGLIVQKKMLLLPKRSHRFNFLVLLIPSYRPTGLQKEGCITSDASMQSKNQHYVQLKSSIYKTS